MKALWLNLWASVVVLTLLVCLANAANDNIIVPGVRCGPFVLGKTTEHEAETKGRQNGIYFEFSRDGVLNSVVVTTRDYRSDRQIRVGATEDEVVRAYGKGRTGNMDLLKGNTVIGKVGDKILFYPGIQFVFAKQRVWAIWLVQKS